MGAFASKACSYSLAVIISLVFFLQAATAQSSQNNIIQFVFTSDAHYGISRAAFQGGTNVESHIVNVAMINKINSLSGLTLPVDSGLNANKTVGPIDYLIEGGDIANREEVPIQSAATSWAQFETDYVHGITLKGHNNQPVQFLIIPGNHDASNAVGFYKPMNPTIDKTSMVNIYNLMVKPAKPVTPNNYNYETDKVNYSENIGGVHFIFITIWPDSLERIWMEKDLQNISATTPVIIVTHDQPECEVKHFTNPNPPYTVNADDKFENLVSERYKDGTKTKGDGASTDIEQRGFVQFLKRHPNIKAYFHGNSNFNQFYTYKGPDNDIALPVFRVDSPIKGKYSSKDETKLSFQLITLDTLAMKLTVRECLWDADPSNASSPVKFGSSATISLN